MTARLFTVISPHGSIPRKNILGEEIIAGVSVVFKPSAWEGYAWRLGRGNGVDFHNSKLADKRSCSSHQTSHRLLSWINSFSHQWEVVSQKKVAIDSFSFIFSCVPLAVLPLRPLGICVWFHKANSCPSTALVPWNSSLHQALMRKEGSHFTHFIKYDEPLHIREQ